jgi:Type IV secretion system pilin
MKLIKYFLAIIICSFSLMSFSPVLVANAAPDTSSLSGLEATANKVDAYKTQTSANAKDTILDRVGGIVGLILSFIGILFLVLTVYAGFLWMTAQGNSGQVDKAKDLLVNAIIGLVIVSAAYSITIFIGNQLVK